MIFVTILIFAFYFEAFAQDRKFEPLSFDPLAHYGKVSANEEKVHLDNLFFKLSQDRAYEGIIVLEFNKKTSVNKRVNRLREIIKLAKFRRHDITQISFAISEKNSEHTTLLALQENSRFFEDLGKDYKLVKAEEFEEKIKELFPTK